MKYLTLFVFILISLFGCKNDPKTAYSKNNAFYYWKTTSRYFDSSDSTFKSLHTKKIYLHLFDVDWDQETASPVPLALFQDNLDVLHDSTPIVPVIFITNETFKQLPTAQIPELAKNIFRKINAAVLTTYSDPYQNEVWWEQNPYNLKSKNFTEMKQNDSMVNAAKSMLKEIQFDCDWTPSTKDKYFLFLKEIKKQFPDKLISSTIRLYQYKYPDKTGVPPADRGMLMCYNAGDVTNIKTPNSIFNKEEIESYLSSNTYALPLDYALPIFSWAAIYQNNTRLTQLISTQELISLHYSELGIDKDSIGKYINRDGFITAASDFVYGNDAHSILIRKGDKIKIEISDLEDVLEISKKLHAIKNNPSAILSLYHLDSYVIQNHSKEIEAIFDSF